MTPPPPGGKDQEVGSMHLQGRAGAGVAYRLFEELALIMNHKQLPSRSRHDRARSVNKGLFRVTDD